MVLNAFVCPYGGGAGAGECLQVEARGQQRSLLCRLFSTLLLFHILRLCVFVCACAAVSLRRLEDNLQEAGGSFSHVGGGFQGLNSDCQA